MGYLDHSSRGDGQRHGRLQYAAQYWRLGGDFDGHHGADFAAPLCTRRRLARHLGSSSMVLQQKSAAIAGYLGPPARPGTGTPGAYGMMYG